jgi:hypothetical protein
LSTILESPLDSLLADPATPRWLRELHRFLPIKSQFVLYGNIRDRVPFPLGRDRYDMRTVSESVVDTLALRGYSAFLAADPVNGLTILSPSDADPEAHVKASRELFERIGEDLDVAFARDRHNGRTQAKATFGRSVQFAERLIHNQDTKCAVLFDYMMGLSESGQSREVDSFIRSLIASYEAVSLGGTFNPVIWLCDRDNELPAWFAFDNPRVRSISIARPDRLVRGIVARSLLRNVTGFDDLDPAMQSVAVEEFSSQTDGMALNDLECIATFCTMESLPASEISEAARRYKLGITEDPWKRMGRSTLDRAEKIARDRVRGQEPAIIKSMDILRRALTGLSGAQGAKASGKPKGVLFFCGPTGVGKTELAKSLTEGLFGDERAYIRFDMSEFNHEHADQRLVGAPPGYVGFEAGGELTDAVRERPCSIILFDEIEKANGKILDKFLQILDDGQLTSGRGDRVYFSDAIIVFTSNLGMDGVAPGTPYEELERQLRAGIAKYFKQTLNRPELLNRIGENIVVFDFIRAEIAIQIFDKMLKNVFARVADAQGIRLSMAPEARNALLVRCTEDTSNGGRGVSNLIESLFVNPLSRALWDAELPPNSGAEITAFELAAGVPRITIGKRV